MEIVRGPLLALGTCIAYIYLLVLAAFGLALSSSILKLHVSKLGLSKEMSRAGNILSINIIDT